MKKIKTQCHICQNVTKDETPPTVCPRCGANLANPSEETVQKKTNCSLNKGLFGSGAGILYLTNRRMLWVKSEANAMTYGGGLVGGVAAAVANSKAKGRKNWFDIPLADLRSVSAKKRGLFGKAMLLTDRENNEYDLSPGKRKEWLPELEQVIKRSYVAK